MSRPELRICLAQLGVQYASAEGAQPHLNVPLALGYLVSGLELAGLLDRCEVRILDVVHCLYASDRAVVAEILAGAPDIVGFSCYCWNIERTLFIASELAARRPDVRIVLGGPEATERSAALLAGSPEIFAVVRGEGEEPFAALIGQILRSSADGTPPPGVSLRKAGGEVLDAPRPFVSAGVERLPSPYVRGYLDPRSYGSLNIETVRGCLFHCDYCYYPKGVRGLRCFPLDRIRSEVRLAVSSGITRGYLMDPVFNIPDRVGPLCTAIAAENPEGQISFQTEARAELIDERVAGLFQAAGIRSVELGLQSTNPAALRSVHRGLSRERFARAVDLLREAGVHPRIGIIIGLPGDRPAEIERTLDFVIGLGVEDIQCFLLQVLPGTVLAREAARLGLVYEEAPPYYILRTAEMDQEEILRAYVQAVRRVRLVASRPQRVPDLGWAREVRAHAAAH